MKTIQVWILALTAVSALSGLLATAASAETTLLAEWLADSTPITANLSVEMPIELASEDAKAPVVGKSALACSMILAGTVGANGADEITEALNLKKELTGALGGLALLGTGTGSDCKSITGCAEGTAASATEYFLTGLPWKTLLFLMENGQFLDLFSAVELGVEILCLILGINVEDKCTEEDGEILVQNNATTGDAEIPSGAELTPAMNCTLGGAGSGINTTVGVGTITLTNGELLSVSSE